MFTGAGISLTNKPKQDAAFDSHSEFNTSRFTKEGKFTFNSEYFKKLPQHFSENGTWE
jgi:hypothetical protein